MRLYRYKASFANDDTGPRFWYMFVTFMVMFTQSYFCVWLYDALLYWIVGIVIATFSFNALNIQRFRAWFYAYWGAFSFFSLLLVLAPLMYFKGDVYIDEIYFTLVILAVTSSVQLFVGIIFFKKFTTTI